MISKEILEAHYIEYASQPDAWVNNMEITKRSIVEHVLKAMQFVPLEDSAKVLVLGASDKRYIPIHKRIFTNVLGQQIQMVTFDIDTKHIGSESNEVILHDVTKPFPDTPYTIVFSHELMKFLTPEEQLQTIQNSYHALSEGGLAMHILHEPSIKGTPELRSWQHRVNPDTLIDRLKEKYMPAIKLVFDSESDVAWLRETTVIVLKKAKN